MVHPYFIRVAGQPKHVNGFAIPGSDHAEKFTKMFATLFPSNALFDDNTASYLEMVVNDFTFNKRKVHIQEETRRQVDALFTSLGISLSALKKESSRFYLFWLYLFEIYWRQTSASPTPDVCRDDHIFGFMPYFNLRDTKVVILASDPSKQCASSGLAFHGSQCPSTQQLLDFVDFEMQLVDHLTGTDNRKQKLTFSREYLMDAKNRCEFNGWINQKVLLLNSFLSYQEPYWAAYTNSLVRYLSRELDNIVFILLGQIAAAKLPLIDHIKHCVVRVHHPSHCARRNEKRSAFSPTSYLEWDRALPFINANFYWYQIFKLKNRGVLMENNNAINGINWSAVKSSTQAGKGRMTRNEQLPLWNTDKYSRYVDLFETAIKSMAMAEKQNPVVSYEESVVDAYVNDNKRNETALIVKRCKKNGRLILRKRYNYNFII